MSKYEYLEYMQGSVLDLSHGAIAGVAEEFKRDLDPGASENDLVTEMEQADFFIRDAVLDAFDEISYRELNSDFEREFVTGAAFSHKGIRYQASIQNEEIPLVDEESSKCLLTAIHLTYRTTGSYIVDRAWHLERYNPLILDSSKEYLDHRRERYCYEGGTAFMAGVIVCHELLYQNIASEAVVDNIIENRQNMN